MKKLILGIFTLSLLFTACSSDDNGTNVVIDDPIEPGDIVTIDESTVELSGQMRGTLLAGKTYFITGDLIIPEGEEIIAEEGVTIIVESSSTGIGYEITNNGTFASLGTEQNPNLISVPEELRTIDNVFAGLWGGIQCSDKADAVVLKWTRMEYVGGEGGPGTPRAGRIRYGLWTLSDQTEVVLENNWFYGSKDDFYRPVGGKLNIVGNVFEMCGEDGGDIINVKGGTVGNIAYNIAIGSATNAFKPSDDGESTIQSNIGIYNNTILNGGHRRAGTNRGSNINFENGARGFAHNNIIVNCKNGIRIVEDADIQNINYDYNLYFASEQTFVDEFIPSDSSSEIQPNIIMGGVGENDPMFVNYNVTQFTLEQYLSGEMQPANMNRMTNEGISYNLRLQSGSPAIGSGTTSFQPVSVNFTLTGALAPTVPAPNVDMGAYPTDGSGNKLF
jgi:hypothetical protein